MGFSRQEYCSELQCPSPGDLPDPGIEPASLTSPALTVGSLPLAPLGKNYYISTSYYSEKAMAPHSSTLAWKIPWMEEPGRLPSMGLLRVRHD